MRKYKNTPTHVDGHRFDSKKEAARYQQLKLLERGGAISQLELQPKYDFIHNGIKICQYRADFRYTENGETVVEDVKSPATAKLTPYRMKKKMMTAFFGIDVKEV